MSTTITSKGIGIGDLIQGPMFCKPPYGVIRRIIVQIRPISGDRPDAIGMNLHCVWKFSYRGDIEQDGIVRVPQFANGISTSEPIYIASNPGSFRINKGVSLMFSGGATGSRWHVEVLELQDNDFGPPDPFTLDATSFEGGPITRNAIGQEWHAYVNPLSGSLFVDGAATVIPGSGKVSLGAISIVAAANTRYQTSVRI